MADAGQGARTVTDDALHRGVSDDTLHAQLDGFGDHRTHNGLPLLEQSGAVIAENAIVDSEGMVRFPFAHNSGTSDASKGTSITVVPAHPWVQAALVSRQGDSSAAMGPQFAGHPVNVCLLPDKSNALGHAGLATLTIADAEQHATAAGVASSIPGTKVVQVVSNSALVFTPQ